MMSSSLDRDIELIDQHNEADPSHLNFEGKVYPVSLIEGVRAHNWVQRLRSDASEPLLIAARGHHLRRWEIPRDSFPRTRKGYLDWRNRLYTFHANAVAEVMNESNYSSDAVALARRLLSKQDIATDAEAQTYEDALSLTFLELRLAAFMKTVSSDQFSRALNRTWQKMSEVGRSAASRLELDPSAAEVVQRLQPPSPPSPP